MTGMVGSALSDAEFGLVQRYIDRVVEEVLELGLSPEIEHDFDIFAKLRRANGFLYPSVDPNFSDLDSDALWVRAVTAHGDTVALSAARVFETDDFYELLRSERIWFRKPPPDAGTRCIIDTADLPEIKGVVAHGGGLWVHPTWRKRGLSHMLPWLVRGLLLRNSAIDYITSLVFEDIALSRLPLTSYAFTRVDKIIDGFFPPTGKAERVYLCRSSRRDIMERIGAELALAEPAPAASD